MNKHDINQEVQLPSDYLLENRNTLERLNGFDEMCEELDALQHEAMQYAFQDGVSVGERIPVPFLVNLAVRICFRSAEILSSSVSRVKFDRAL